MICPVCKGLGEVDNPRYNNLPSWKVYEDGIPSRKKCRKCAGQGYILGNVSDAINLLNGAVTDNRGLTAKETKQLLNILNNYKNGIK